MNDMPDRPPFKWTLGQVRDMNLELECACETPGCGWVGRFNVAALIEELGADYRLPDDGPGFPCEKCGGKDVKFQVAYLHPDPDEEQR